MSDVNAFVFPGGKLRHIAVAPTVGDANYDASPGAGFRWVILSAYITLVTDATVANRYLQWNFYETGGVKLRGGAETTVVAASLTRTMALQNEGDERLLNMTPLTNFVWGTRPLLLEGTDYMRISIRAGVAGDSYSGFITVLEMKL